MGKLSWEEKDFQQHMKLFYDLVISNMGLWPRPILTRMRFLLQLTKTKCAYWNAVIENEIINLVKKKVQELKESDMSGLLEVYMRKNFNFYTSLERVNNLKIQLEEIKNKKIIILNYLMSIKIRI